MSEREAAVSSPVKAHLPFADLTGLTPEQRAFQQTHPRVRQQILQGLFRSGNPAYAPLASIHHVQGQVDRLRASQSRPSPYVHPREQQPWGNTAQHPQGTTMLTPLVRPSYRRQYVGAAKTPGQQAADDFLNSSDYWGLVDQGHHPEHRETEHEFPNYEEHYNVYPGHDFAGPAQDRAADSWEGDEDGEENDEEPRREEPEYVEGPHGEDEQYLHDQMQRDGFTYRRDGEYGKTDEHGNWHTVMMPGDYRRARTITTEFYNPRTEETRTHTGHPHVDSALDRLDINQAYSHAQAAGSHADYSTHYRNWVRANPQSYSAQLHRQNGWRLGAVVPGDTQHGLGHGHTAPRSGPTMDDPEDAGLQDVYDHPEYFVQPRDPRDPLVHRSGMENWQAVKAARGNPDAAVKIYRAVPHGVTAIEGNTNPAGASWVSASPSYAKRHAEAESCPSCGGDMQVISGTARAGDLHNEGYLEEWGYTGNPLQDDSALSECPEGAFEKRKADEAEFMKRMGAAGPRLTWDEIGERHPSIYGDPEVHGEAADGADGEGIGWAAAHLAFERPGHEEPDEGSWDLDFHLQDVPVHQIDYARAGMDDPRVRSARRWYQEAPDEVVPPVLVHRHGVYQVADGHHRSEAAGYWDLPTIPAYVAQSPHEDEPFADGARGPYHGADPVSKTSAAIPDETGLKAAGIAVIAMDTGRVLMLQRALNPMTCPCGMGVTWDEMNGYQHDDGSVSHDDSDMSVSEMLDQGHDSDKLCPCCLGQGDDLQGSECSSCDGSGTDQEEPSCTPPCREVDGLGKTAMPRDDAFLSGLTHEYTAPGQPIRNSGKSAIGHEINSYTNDGVNVGHLSWSPYDGTISYIKVHPKYRNRGLATDLFRRAYDMHVNDPDNIPHPEHDYADLSDDARGWIEHGLGEDIPDFDQDENDFSRTAALEFDPHEGTWEFPGGKMDAGEPARDAASREFREEVGQDLPPGIFVGAWVSPGGIVVSAGFTPARPGDTRLRLAGTQHVAVSPIIPAPDAHHDALIAAGWTPRPEGKSDIYPDYTKLSPQTGVHHQVSWARDTGDTWLYDATVPHETTFMGRRTVNPQYPGRVFEGKGAVPLADPAAIEKTRKDFERGYLVGSQHGETGIAHHFNDRSKFEDRWGDSEPRADRLGYEPDTAAVTQRSEPAFERSRRGDPMRGTHPEPDVSYDDFRIPKPGEPWIEGLHNMDLLAEPPHMNPFGGMEKLNAVDPAYQKEFHQYLDREVGYSPEDFAAMSPKDQRELADGFGHYIGEDHPRDARFHLEVGGAGHQKVRTGTPGQNVRVLRVEKPDGTGPFAYGGEDGATIPRPFEREHPDGLYSLLNPYEEDDPDRATVRQRQPYADGIPARYVRGRSFGFLPQHNVHDYFTPKMISGLHDMGYGMSEYDVPGESLVLGRTQVAWKPEDATRVSHTPLAEHLATLPKMAAATKAPVYKGFIYLIQAEKDIDLDARAIANPDDPDGDMSEQCAWWDIEHAKKNPALRKEVKAGTPWDEFELWADKSVRTNKGIKEALAKLASDEGWRKGRSSSEPDWVKDHNPEDAIKGSSTEDRVRRGDPAAGENWWEYEPSKKQAKTAGKCSYCKQPATKEIKHSEGMGLISTCDKHLEKGKTDAAACVPFGDPDPSNIDWVHDASVRVAMPTTEHEPGVHGFEGSGEGALNRKVTLPSGEWLAKSPHHTHLNDPAYADPEDHDYFRGRADEDTDMEEFASRFGRAISDPGDEAITPEVIRGTKASDPGPTAYVRRYPEFRDMDNGWLDYDDLEHHTNSPRGKLMGYFHSVLSDGDHVDHHNMLLLGDPMEDSSEKIHKMPTVSIDHTHSSIPAFAEARAGGDKDHARSMTWAHQGELSPYTEAHFLGLRGGQPVRKMSNPLAPGDTDRAIAASETMRPWAKERGREDWLDAAQHRMKLLGQRAGGAESMFPYQMAHEQMQRAGTKRPSRPSWSRTRQMITTGRPEFEIRSDDEIPYNQHDAIVTNELPEFHEDPGYESGHPKIYGLMSGNKQSFLAPVRHKETGDVGWLRGGERSEPSAWAFYPEDDLPNALRGAKPGSVPRGVVQEGPSPADLRYVRQRATGKPLPDAVGDVETDKQGHQVVHRRPDPFAEFARQRGGWSTTSSTDQQWWSYPEA